MVARRIEQRGGPGPLEFDEANFALNSEAGVHYLGNVYAEYCAAPWRGRRQALDGFVRSFMEVGEDLPSSFDDARPDLLPKVRERFFHEALRLRGRLQTQEFPEVPYRILAEHLAVDVVYDTPNSVRTVPPEDMDRWGIGFEEAMAVARDNLWRISNQPFGVLAPGAYVSTWQDTHDATRMFLHDLVWQLDVKGSHVAMVPDRNVLLVTGSDDAEGLRRIAAEAKHILEHSPRPMSGFAFILDGDTWQPFMPPADCPAYGELAVLAVQSMASMYGEQQGLMDAIHERGGTSVYVATYDAVQEEDTGRVRSRCTWTRGVDSLLPETDMVALVDTDLAEGDQMLGFAEWGQLASVVGAMLKTCPDVYPVRYRATEFPSQEQLARIELSEP